MPPNPHKHPPQHQKTQGGKFCGIKDASVLEYSGLLKDRTSRLFAIAGELCAVPGITEHAIPPETVRHVVFFLGGGWKVGLTCASMCVCGGSI